MNLKRYRPSLGSGDFTKRAILVIYYPRLRNPYYGSLQILVSMYCQFFQQSGSVKYFTQLGRLACDVGFLQISLTKVGFVDPVYRSAAQGLAQLWLFPQKFVQITELWPDVCLILLENQRVLVESGAEQK